MAVELKVDPKPFADLVGKSSRLEPRLKAELRKKIRAAATPAANAVKAAAMQPGQTRAAHPRSTGLRARIAGKVRVAISASSNGAGVRIVSGGPLAAAWESKKGWRHPLFGRRTTYYQQSGNPYFRNPIFARRNEIRHDVEKAMADAAKTLEGGR